MYYYAAARDPSTRRCAPFRARHLPCRPIPCRSHRCSPPGPSAANFAEIKPPLRPPEASAEAARWLYSFGAPCITACPSGIDVPAFIKKIARNNPVGAARTTLTAIAAL